MCSNFVAHELRWCRGLSPFADLPRRGGPLATFGLGDGALMMRQTERERESGASVERDLNLGGGVMGPNLGLLFASPFLTRHGAHLAPRSLALAPHASHIFFGATLCRRLHGNSTAAAIFSPRHHNLLQT